MQSLQGRLRSDPGANLVLGMFVSPRSPDRAVTAIVAAVWNPEYWRGSWKLVLLAHTLKAVDRKLQSILCVVHLLHCPWSCSCQDISRAHAYRSGSSIPLGFLLPAQSPKRNSRDNTN